MSNKNLESLMIRVCNLETFIHKLCRKLYPKVAIAPYRVYTQTEWLDKQNELLEKQSIIGDIDTKLTALQKYLKLDYHTECTEDLPRFEKQKKKK